MHPDRNFATLASLSLEPAAVLAQLERCKTGTLLAADAARRVLFCDAPDVADGGLEVRRTLHLGGADFIEADELRGWLKQPAEPGRHLRVVVNEGAGPYLCRPVQMGADVVVEDLGGLLGEGLAGTAFVGARGDEALARFLACLGVEGPVRQAPCERQLLQLSTLIPQLSLVSQARCDRALVAAQYLCHHPRVTWVGYPGLAEDPANAEARRSMEHGFGWRVAFRPPEGCAGFAQGLWDAPMGPLASRVELRLDGVCVLHAGLEEALDVVGALERGLACPESREGRA